MQRRVAKIAAEGPDLSRFDPMDRTRCARHPIEAAKTDVGIGHVGFPRADENDACFAPTASGDILGAPER